MKLITPIFTIDAYCEIIAKLEGLSVRPILKWKNLLATYPLFIKKYYLETPLLPKPKTCLSLGGMYFLYFHRHFPEFPLPLKEFLASEQVLKDITDFLVYHDKKDLAIFQSLVVYSGSCDNIISNQDFNRTLEGLIEDYTIIPKGCKEGIVFDVREEEEDVCTLEALLKTYLPNMTLK